jgi:hypothetical protein
MPVPNPGFIERIGLKSPVEEQLFITLMDGGDFLG